MSIRTITTLLAFIISPLLLGSLGSALSSLTRIYVNSGTFSLSIILGALVTSSYYASYLKSKAKKIALIFLFGVLTPLLYINAAIAIYGSGVETQSQVWSPIFAITTLIGLFEILLYLAIFFISFIKVISSFFKAITTRAPKKQKNEVQNNILPIPETKWSWANGNVDRTKAYIELRYGDMEESSYKDWITVAYIGAPEEGVFPVQFLIDGGSKEEKAALKAAKKELNFYLVEKGEPDPWLYVQYHCTTAANIYSNLHWSFFSPRQNREKENREIQWEAYDPSWLVEASQPYKDEYPWLPATLEACTRAYSDDPAYIYFVESKNANQPGAAWQFQENIILEDTPEGEIILDIIKPNRVGGIEFYDKLD